MARMLVVDSGGTTREVSRFAVVDSGGTPRIIKRGFIIDSGGTARLFFQYLTATLSDNGYTRFGTSPAGFSISSDGYVYGSVAGSFLNQLYLWLVAGNASDFEVRVDVLSGSFSTGTTGAWQSCASDRTWTRQSGAGTFQSVTFTVQIRRASDASVAASATVDLTCDRT